MRTEIADAERCPGGGGAGGVNKTLCVQRYTHGIMRGPRLKHPRTAKSPLLPALPRTDGSRRFNKRPAFRTLVPTRGARASSSCSLASSRHLRAPARATVARTSAGLLAFVVAEPVGGSGRVPLTFPHEPRSDAVTRYA